jgi:Arc/MetJ family transcription regulator
VTEAVFTLDPPVDLLARARAWPLLQSHLDALVVRARAQAAEEARLKRDEEALQAALRASVQTAAAEARAAAEAEASDRDAAVAAVDAAAAAEAVSGGS